MSDDRLGDDILSGVPAIAEFLNEKEWECRWHIRQGHYDAALYRVGRIIKARKSVLRKIHSPSQAPTFAA
jgi:hypothetical protein